jgi:hypothetical protein
LRHVIWQSFSHRGERGILKPYWQLQQGHEFHDGVCVTLLLAAVRRALNEMHKPGSVCGSRMRIRAFRRTAAVSAP